MTTPDISDNPLIPLIEKYVTADSASAARTLESLPESQADEIFNAIPPEIAAMILPNLQISFAALLVQNMEPEPFKIVIQNAEPKRAASILMRVSPEALERLLPHTPKKIKEEAQAQLVYPEDCIGRVMTTDYLSFHAKDRVSDAVRKIRQHASKRNPASYVYVEDHENRLVGVINMRDLLLGADDAFLDTISRKDIFTLHCFMPCADAAEELSKRRYFAAPVVDDENRMLGIVKVEQLLHGAQQDVAESIQRMFGGSPDERTFSPMWFKLKMRLPWLHINLATAFMAAYVVSMFEATIAKITILAVFLPVVAGQGGNAGAQSLAIVMRGLVMREIPQKKVLILILRESLLGLITGIITGVVTGLIAWFWQGNAVLGLVIGMGMVINLFFAGLSGAAIPIVMKSFGLDPAQCSNIILTTITDVVGFIAFLGLAVLFQSYLI